MITRREAIRLLGSASAATPFAGAAGTFGLVAAPVADAVRGETPPLAPGAPNSPERLALIESFRKQSDGLEKKFEARTHKSDAVMPYRLFRPDASGKSPLVTYLHGSGGLGNDNLKQLALGNIFGTRVWLLPENQKRFPCYVLAPQTAEGWIRYDLARDTLGPAPILPGLGNGARRTFEIIDQLVREFPIDNNRIYVTGQSMGGAGAWHMLAQRPRFFAASVICCGGTSTEDGSASADTPLWNFHGDSDKTVSVSLSRQRIEARRKAGGHPLYTEYAGIDHNVWQWAYTEPQLLPWLFSRRRP
jgi:predicted peptidase